MSYTITTPDGAALMNALAFGWGGRPGIRWNCLIARHALARARDNIEITWAVKDTQGYPVWRRNALARVKRCREAVRKTNAELAEWEERYATNTCAMAEPEAREPGEAWHRPHSPVCP